MRCAEGPNVGVSQSEVAAAAAVAQVDQDRLRAELVNLACRNQPASYVAAALNGGAVAYMVSGHMPSAVVFGWLAALIGFNTLRTGLTVYYLRSMRPVRESGRWYAIMSVGVVGQAAIWGVGAWLFFPIESMLVRAFVALIIAGVTAGGVSVLSPLREGALAWVVLLVAPIVWHALRFGEVGWVLFGVACLLFIATEAVAVLSAHRRFIDSVRLAFENEELVATLFRSKRALETTNRALEGARDEALRAAQAKADFLANMSHEIRTPMTAILGYADLLRERPSAEDLETFTQAIQRSGRHLLVIINDILDFSKIDAGKMTLERIACDPAQVIESALDMVSERSREKGIALRRDLRPPFPRTVLSDPVRLQQILVNLLANAIKFTQQGEVCVEAFAERKGDAGRLLIRVRDTGIGMSVEQVERLFRPFTQADETITRRYGGTGLGLSISHRLANLLGGELSASSEPGHGSCFKLALDLGDWDGLELGVPRVASRPTPAARAKVWRFSGRVLLAEDGRENQRLIRILLERRGLEVELVENGRQAVERASAAWSDGQAHDLVLMDVQMPELDGMSATRELKRLGFPSPIVALTAQALEGDRQACLEAGYDDYETKPINPQRLDRLLARYVPGERSSD
jgi:signal transduction histidine kinase/ActR/RegA family two-component response regulator